MNQQRMVVSPSRNMSALGWIWIILGVLAIFIFVTFVVALQHTSETYHVGSIALDDTGASLHGTLTFSCSANRLNYMLQYSVPMAEKVTRLRLEYQQVVGPNAPDAVPLCQNTALDPINPYGGPNCPSAIPCSGSACYVGTLSAAGHSTLVMEYDECKSLRDSPTLIYLRLYTDVHPQGIAVASVTRHSTT